MPWKNNARGQQDNVHADTAPGPEQGLEHLLPGRCRHLRCGLRDQTVGAEPGAGRPGDPWRRHRIPARLPGRRPRGRRAAPAPSPEQSSLARIARLSAWPDPALLRDPLAYRVVRPAAVHRGRVLHRGWRPAAGRRAGRRDRAAHARARRGRAPDLAHGGGGRRAGDLRPACRVSGRSGDRGLQFAFLVTLPALLLSGLLVLLALRTYLPDVAAALILLVNCPAPLYTGDGID